MDDQASFALLGRLIDVMHEAVVLPEEVGPLLRQCDALIARSDDANVNAGLERIKSVATSAKNYDLGICILGDG